MDNKITIYGFDVNCEKSRYPDNYICFTTLWMEDKQVTPMGSLPKSKINSRKPHYGRYYFTIEADMNDFANEYCKNKA